MLFYWKVSELFRTSALKANSLACAPTGHGTCVNESSNLYYKPIIIVNEDSGVVTKLETLFTDDARVVIYNRHMFIVQATESLYVSIVKGLMSYTLTH